MAIRPTDINDPTAGYDKISYVYPFSFNIQGVVSNIESTSSAWNFEVCLLKPSLASSTFHTLSPTGGRRKYVDIRFKSNPGVADHN